jgi:hypothetical protein
MRLFEFVGRNIVYHGTDLAHAELIMKNNCMYADDPTGKKNTKNDDEEKISFTRNFGMGFTYAGGDYKIPNKNSTGVIFCFDYNKLKQKYGKRLQPLEMMYGWPEQEDDTGWGSHSSAIKDKYRSVDEGYSPEVEEGLWIDKLPNVDSYLTQIVVILTDEQANKIDKKKYPHIFSNPK